MSETEAGAYPSVCTYSKYSKSDFVIVDCVSGPPRCPLYSRWRQLCTLPYLLNYWKWWLSSLALQGLLNIITLLHDLHISQCIRVRIKLTYVYRQIFLRMSCLRKLKSEEQFRWVSKEYLYLSVPNHSSAVPLHSLCLALETSYFHLFSSLLRNVSSSFPHASALWPLSPACTALLPVFHGETSWWWRPLSAHGGITGWFFGPEKWLCYLTSRLCWYAW